MSGAASASDRLQVLGHNWLLVGIDAALVKERKVAAQFRRIPAIAQGGDIHYSTWVWNLNSSGQTKTRILRGD